MVVVGGFKKSLVEKLLFIIKFWSSSLHLAMAARRISSLLSRSLSVSSAFSLSLGDSTHSSSLFFFLSFFLSWPMVMMVVLFCFWVLVVFLCWVCLYVTSQSLSCVHEIEIKEEFMEKRKKNCKILSG